MIDILMIIISILFVIIAIVVFVLLLNHKNKLKNETKEFLPLGKIVEVNKSKLHVYAEGKKDRTIVFMAGHGTSCPTLDFKPLWMRLLDDYRIVVVERAGYGWSEPSNKPKDVDSMLEETRNTLMLSGEKAPYILFPHSMSGLEALYWAQKYPNEVEAIVGLDSCTPESIEILSKPNRVQIYFMYFISRIGLTRFIPKSEIGNSLPLMNSSELSEEDKNQYLRVFYKSAFTKDMLREIDCLEANAKTVGEKETPIKTPMYFFISDEQEKTVKGWKQTIIEYLSKTMNSKYQQLNASHYIHHDKADVIAKEAKMFLKSIV